MAGSPKRHQIQKWGWAAFGCLGLLEAIRGDISQLWEKPMADSVPIIFLLSVAALAIGAWGAEEAAEANQSEPPSGAREVD